MPDGAVDSSRIYLLMQVGTPTRLARFTETRSPIQRTMGVLKRLCGALRPDEQIIYRRPFPRGPFYEMLNIDDHTGFQVRGARAHANPFVPDYRRDDDVFSKCDSAYPVVGLVQHPGKRSWKIRGRHWSNRTRAPTMA